MKTKVLVVSDDEKLLADIREVEESVKQNSSFYFSTTEDEAKRLLGSEEFAVVCIEFSTSKINGLEFLSLIKDKYPKTFRVLFTDPSKRERAVYSTSDVHRFINKPLRDQEFVKSIEHFQSLSKYDLDSKTISAILGIGTIPTIPEVYLRLEREINKPEVSIHRIADIISNDPLAAAKVMHIVYSSFYNISKSIVNLVHAINFLGLDIIKSLVLYIKVFILKNQPPEIQNYLKKVRDHSIDVAKVSKAIMNLECKDRNLIDSAYIAGLLHDIGKIIMVQSSDKSKRMAFVSEHASDNQLEKEIEKFGVSHVNAGAYLLSSWSFPTELILSVADHHNHEIIRDGELGLNQIVYIANALVNANDLCVDEIKTIYGVERVE
ncbi:MAG: HDOD domain-containing protein, partial [Melioribacteraceae bacterium]